LFEGGGCHLGYPDEHIGENDRMTKMSKTSL